MAVLTTKQLALMRREVGDGVVPVTWDKPTINTALQGAEDVLEAQGFDATAFVAAATRTDARAQTVKDDLDGNRIPFTLVSVVEDWLIEHPPFVTKRSVDVDGIRTWAAGNRPAFAAAVARMPSAQRREVVLSVIRRRVEAVI